MNVTVYAASSSQVPEAYAEQARLLGRILAHRGHTLLNGAGRTGLMGATTDGCLEAGGRAVGIIPKFMVDQGWEHQDMTELIVTPGMHERKELMASCADACIALPGGVGTMEELLEIITWKQLGLYIKPIVLLNMGGFFDALLAQMQRAVDEHFMRPLHQGLWCVAETPEEAVRLAETTPLWDPSIRKLAAL